MFPRTYTDTLFKDSKKILGKELTGPWCVGVGSHFAMQVEGITERIKPMYGKHFEKMYTGSLLGAGAEVFALMGYVISHQKPPDFTVEINPKLVCVMLGEPEEEIQEALDFLCKPDPKSRSEKEEGRRLVRVGQFLYRVVNGPDYHGIKSQEELRAYWREQKRNKKDDSNKQEDHYHKDSRTIIHLLNEASGKAFREVDSNLSVISARLREGGVSLEGVKAMIHRQCKRWKGTPQEEFLRPETLFGKTKFDGYYAAKDQPVQQTLGPIQNQI
jgi:uncharacterized phage protein (TIGR02220 family)